MAVQKYLWIISLFVLMCIGSCSKDYSYEGGPFRNCIACTYLPLCDSSTFVYLDSTATGIDTLGGAVRIQNDTVVNGKTYKSVNGFAAFSNGLLYNCDNQDYKVLVSLSAFGINTDSIANVILQGLNLPFPISPSALNLPKELRTSVLKAALPVNGTWTDTLYSFAFPPLVSIYLGLDYTILEKNATRTVYGKTYSDVIHVNGTLKTVTTLGNFPLNISLDYYFSKDVGIIEMIVQDSGVEQNHLRLFSYKI